MDSELLATLSQASQPEDFQVIMRRFSPTLVTIEALKEEVSQYHFIQPAHAVTLAQNVSVLSQQLSLQAQALGLWMLGNAYVHNSQYNEASDALRQARSIYIAQGMMLDAARLAVGLIGVMAYSNQLQDALTLAEEIELLLSVSAQTDPQDMRRLAMLPTNIGIVHELLGNFEESIDTYDRSIPILNQLGDKHLLARVHHNRAHALTQIGALEEALVAYDQACQGFLAEKKTADVVRLLINRSQLLMRLHRYREAQEVLTDAGIRLSPLTGQEQNSHRLTLSRAQLSLKTETAISQTLLLKLQQAQRSFATHGPLLEEGLAWLLLGDCHRVRDEEEEAENCYKQTLQLVAQGTDRALEQKALHGLARLSQAQNKREEALAYYQSAINKLETMRGDLQIESFRTAFLADKLDVYYDLTQFFLDQQQLPEAFAVIERAKSRLVTEKLASRLVGEVQRATKVKDSTVRMLSERVQTTLHELEHLYQHARGNSLRGDEPISTSDNAYNTISQLEATLQQTIMQLQRQQPVFSALTIGQTIELPQLQEVLENAIFLQYHLLGDRLAVFVVDRNGIQGYCQVAKLEQIERASREFFIAIQSMQDLLKVMEGEQLVRRLPMLLAGINKSLGKLYEYLVQPIEGLLPADCPLIFSADGILHLLPFHALFDGERYLVERWGISSVPSATLLDVCHRYHSQRHGSLLIGYDDQRLQAVASELAKLRELYPNAKYFIADAATTDSFLAHAPHVRLLHIAAHAAFRRDKPMLSSITLADRRLTLAEISRLNLAADLVTLSGCETGFGNVQGGELLSLATGFLGAGVRSLIVSLWRVEDHSTALLMDSFYQALNRGESYALALCSAQRSLIELGRSQNGSMSLYRHPLFWAPFTLIGNPLGVLGRL